MNHTNNYGRTGSDAGGMQTMRQAVSQCSPPPRSGSMDDRLENLRQLCARLHTLQVRLTSIADGIRCQPSDATKEQGRPEPSDLLSKFGISLDFAGDRIIALEDLVQRIDASLFNHENRAQCVAPR